MIELKDASIRRDGRVLFKDVNLQIHPGWKIGLTGNNGTGKSSFFATLLTQKGEGELALDTGSLSVPNSWQIGHMAQEIESTDQSAIDFVLSGDKEYFELQDKINHPDILSEDELAHVHARFDDIHGYSTPAKASQIMTGLGFNVAQESQPVSSFSGGWRMRLNLAKTLMSRADLLLLDEPTNHLDLDAILWLEEWLKAYDGTLLMISHDQAFLDNVVSNILHIENQQMTLYTGNYSTFVRTRSDSEGNNDLMLRVYVTGGGCSGFSYGFNFEENLGDDDATFSNDDVALVVDSLSYQYLHGSTIDYVEGLEGSRFTVNNPNATTTCGCGSSFSI